MSQILGKPIEQALDGENNPIEFDIAYPLRSNLLAAVQYLRELHEGDIYLLPMSGTSCGGGIFQARKNYPGTVIGLRFDPPVTPRVRQAGDIALTQIEADEIILDTERQSISAGSAVTLEQLSQALQQELGQAYKVPGADLTSYQYAAVGATFMTGGMGPQRRYFSDSVTAVSIFDGTRITEISGDALQGYAGSYGWSGMVTAVQCSYYRFPENEIAFALPVSSAPESLARLLDHLAPLCYLQLEADQVRSKFSQSDLILGIEHVSAASMQPLLNNAGDSDAGRRAQGLQQTCTAAAADGVVFVNGLSHDSVDEFLHRLVDDPHAGEFSIAGIALEHAEIFSNPDAMRALREAIPYAARMQTPQQTFVYKNHTDANVRLAEDRVAMSMTLLWQINCDYIAGIEQYFLTHQDVRGEVLVYGHLNPYGVDPHNRVTMSCDDEALFRQSREFLIEQRAQYFRSLIALCETCGAAFVGGEKTADSEIGIYRALGGPQNAPDALRNRFQRQSRVIRAAAPMFNWRAPSPYV